MHKSILFSSILALGELLVSESVIHFSTENRHRNAAFYDVIVTIEAAPVTTDFSPPSVNFFLKNSKEFFGNWQNLLKIL